MRLELEDFSMFSPIRRTFHILIFHTRELYEIANLLHLGADMKIL